MSWNNRFQQTPETEIKNPEHSTFSIKNHLYLILYLAGEAPQRVCFDLSSARISQIGAETDDNGKIHHLGGTLHRNSPRIDRPNH